MKGKIFNTMEICKILDLSPSLFRCLRDEEGIIPYHNDGGSLYYRGEDIEELLNNHVIEKFFEDIDSLFGLLADEDEGSLDNDRRD